MDGVNLVSFSDTHAEVIRTNRSGEVEDMWWRLLDPDADISVALGNTGRTGCLNFPIGAIGRESIGLLQLDDRLRARESVIQGMYEASQDTSRPDRERNFALMYLAAASDPTVAIANRASRANKHVRDGKNGEPYHMARTSSGLYVFASHLGALADLELQDRILELRKVPRDNSAYDLHEQFRSSKVVQLLARLSTDTECVFDYDSPEDLITAKNENKHPADIPTELPDSIAYVDKFGNLIGRTRKIEQIIAMPLGSIATMTIVICGRQIDLPVIRSEDLRSAPVNQIVIYPGAERTHGPSSYEIVARVDDDPSLSTGTAAFQILDMYQRTQPQKLFSKMGKLVRQNLGLPGSFVVNTQDAPISLRICS